MKLIEATVDMNLADNHEYVIKPSFDDGLTGKLIYLSQLNNVCQ